MVNFALLLIEESRGLLKRTVLIRISLSLFFAFYLSLSLTGRPEKADKNTAEHYNILGLRLLKKSKYHKAEEYFLMAIEKNPTVKYYHNNLAAVYMKRGDYNRAYASLNRCISIDGNYVKALANIAITAFRLSRYLESYAYYKRALKADPVYTRKRFEKNRVMKYLRLLPGPEQENNGFSRAVRFIEDSN